MATLLQVTGLEKHFAVHRGFWQGERSRLRAVDGITFHLDRRQTLGLVGESGCGKTTTARSIVRLIEPTAGNVHFGGVDLGRCNAGELRRIRPKMQMIFQDPYASLDPRMSVGRSVAEPLLEHTDLTRTERREAVERLFDTVGLQPSLVGRSPHEFSGGQRQRIGIARALALKPDLVVCDEPISALDVSIQAQIVNLLEEVQDQFGLSYLFISHDLRMVRHLSDRVAVMYLGKIAEIGDAAELFSRPQHPYTRALWEAVYDLGSGGSPSRPARALSTQPGSSAVPATGCRFSARCPYAESRCHEVEPLLRSIDADHEVACHLV